MHWNTRHARVSSAIPRGLHWDCTVTRATRAKWRVARVFVSEFEGHARVGPCILLLVWKIFNGLNGKLGLVAQLLKSVTVHNLPFYGPFWGF